MMVVCKITAIASELYLFKRATHSFVTFSPIEKESVDDIKALCFGIDHRDASKLPIQPAQRDEFHEKKEIYSGYG